MPAFLSPGKPPHLLSALFRSPAPPRVTGRREQGSASCEDGVSLWLILLRGATAWIERDSLAAGLSFPLPLLHRPVRRVQALLFSLPSPPLGEAVGSSTAQLDEEQAAWFPLLAGTSVSPGDSLRALPSP